MKNATNQALLKALGITQPHITALQIHVQPNKLPTVTMDCLLDAKAMLHKVSHFDLVLREEPAPATAPAPALDLDAMCAAARARVTGEADVLATMALTMHRRESAAIRTRLDQALLRRRTKAMTALATLDLSLLVKDLARKAAAIGIFGGSLGALSSPGLAKTLADSPCFDPVSFTYGGERK